MTEEQFWELLELTWQVYHNTNVMQNKKDWTIDWEEE